METKMNGAGLMSVGLMGLLPALAMAADADDFQALISFVLWILIGAVIVKVLVIFAGIS